MSARALFQAGKLDQAIEAVGADLRNDPTNVRNRTFLFELLCFAGAWDRAEKQLDIIAGASKEAGMGALVYRSALHAERLRQQMFAAGELPAAGHVNGDVGGTLNGRPFRSIADADPRIGPRLEIFAAGQYTWVPFEHIASIRMEAPKLARDLIWGSARVLTGPSFGGTELGEVILPMLAPLTARHADDELRLGRASDWEELADGRYAPVGQKLLLVDDEPVPILEIRELQISPAPVAA